MRYLRVGNSSFTPTPNRDCGASILRCFSFGRLFAYLFFDVWEWLREKYLSRLGVGVNNLLISPYLIRKKYK